MKTLPVKPRQMLIASAIFLALAFALGLYAFRGAIFVPKEIVKEDKVMVPAPDLVPVARDPLWGSPTDLGEMGTPVRFERKPLVAVVSIDNAVEARPQSGLADAFLVIEAPAESNIPRFLAFFGFRSIEGVSPKPIGPVRSARPYFLDWAEGFDSPVFLHVGGSPEALASLPNRRLFNEDEFARGAIFRDATRAAPHNAYTNFDTITKKVCEPAIELEGAGASPCNVDHFYSTFVFDDKPTEQGMPASILTVDFSASVNQVVWTYDLQETKWRRAQGGKETVTREGEKILASNVAVMVTDISILDNVGRRKIRTTGEGKAFVFRDGRKIEATWKMPSTQDRIHFYDLTGLEIPMRSGSTWIEVLSDEGQMKVQ